MNPPLTLSNVEILCYNLDISSSIAESSEHESQNGCSDEDALKQKRDRNKVHARQSRERKKMVVDAFEQQFERLRAENMGLRTLVSSTLPPDIAREVFRRCDNVIKDYTPTRVESFIDKLHTEKSVSEDDLKLLDTLQNSQQNFLITDPNLVDNPIVFASDGFCELTGYSRSEILGRNCRFLQGPNTNPAAVSAIRDSVSQGKEISICILNYKADGSPFWNQLFLAPIKDCFNHIVNFVGVQCVVQARKQDEETAL